MESDYLRIPKELQDDLEAQQFWEGVEAEQEREKRLHEAGILLELAGELKFG